MYSKILQILMLLSSTILLAQGNNSIKFIDVEKIKNEILQNQNYPYKNQSFDMLFILLLDSSEKNTFFQNDPRLKEEFYEYLPSLKLNSYTVGFVTQEQSIKSVLMDNVSIGRILNCVYTPQFADSNTIEFSSPIFISKENCAIFQTHSSFTTDTYFIRLNHGVVQINWLGGTIE